MPKAIDDMVLDEENDKESIIPRLSISKTNSSLKARITSYLKREKEMKAYLLKNPDEWGRFQSEFNEEVNGFFKEIMDFERQCYVFGEENKIDKLKKIFVKKFRKRFLHGDYIKWSLEKPYGYSGDFNIIDNIYRNEPTTKGFDRLFDNYFQMSAISIAVRNRKKDFKAFISDYVLDRKKKSTKIMNLACGPCREIKELFNESLVDFKNVVFECYDHDSRALEYAEDLLLDSNPNLKVEFIKGNALKIAAAQDIKKRIPKKYDFIYSMGLFDYLNYKISVGLIHNLYELLVPGGRMVVADVRDKYSNPSMHFMEWVGDWNLLYRSEEDFLSICKAAGIESKNINIGHEQQGIMQYVVMDKT